MSYPIIPVLLLSAVVACSGPAVAQQHKLTLVLAGDAYQGKPEFRVSIGGVQVGTGAVSTAAGVVLGTAGRQSPDLETFEFAVPNIPCLKGASLEIALTNDLWVEGGGDRNLYIAAASIDGVEITLGSFVLADGSVNAPVAGLLPVYSAEQVAVATPPAGGWIGSAAECSLSRFDTALVNFDLVVVNSVATLPGDGGGMTAFDDGVLIAREPSGLLWFYDYSRENLRRSKLRLPPTNIEKVPGRTAAGTPIRRELLRYNDIALVDREGRANLLASYSYYDDAQGCVFNRLAATPLPDDWREALRADQPIATEWRVVFETSPCLQLNENAADVLGTAQAGGRMAISGGTAYLTVGDFEIDGVGDDGPLYPQLTDASYGKVFAIALKDWSATIVSRGHRNPQGITVDGEGRIWEVEHGPQGGDELNLIEAGQNYGWPLETLGVNYGPSDSDEKSWPNSEFPGRHDGYRQPVFAWLPSIAPSNVKLVEGVTPRWDGDLLLGSLVGESLLRLRMNGASVQYAERMQVGQRVRYVLPARGRIYLLFDSGQFAFLSPHVMLDRAEAGAAVDALTRSGCMQCHSAAGMPRLAGIAGTDIASQPGVGYSDALMARPGTWTDEALRQFLADTQSFAPGSAMPPQALSDAALAEVMAALQ